MQYYKWYKIGTYDSQLNEKLNSQVFKLEEIGLQNGRLVAKLTSNTGKECFIINFKDIQRILVHYDNEQKMLHDNPPVEFVEVEETVGMHSAHQSDMHTKLRPGARTWQFES